MMSIKMRKRKFKIFLICFIVAFISLFTFCYTSFATTKQYFLGDVNLDNSITLSDELLLLRHIYSLKTGKNKTWQLTGDALVSADINQNDSVDLSDVVCMKRYLLSQKDPNVANAHTDWKTLCKKVTKPQPDEVSSYTLTLNPGNKTYTKEENSTMIVTAPDNSYTVYFDGNGGSTPDSQVSATIFSNWSLSGGGKLADSKTSPTTYTFGNKDATLTANYKAEGSAITLPVSVRDGYAIEGWYDSKSFNNKIGGVGDSYSPTNDITLYAKWTTQKIEPSSISFDTNRFVLDINNNRTQQLNASIVPANSNYNNGLTWFSSDTSVATVSDSGFVNGVSNGSAIITVRTENGKSASCSVTVQTTPTGVSLNVTDKTLDLSGNNTFTIVPSIIPSTANVDTSIEIINSNTSVVSVSDQGVVTGVSNGSSVITIKTANGRFATCNVTVQTSPTGVSLNKSSLSIDSSVSITERLTATITPSSSNVYTGLTWNSSNPNVATVSNTGLVTGRTTGNTTITVSTQNGKSASCNVSVSIIQTDPDVTNIYLNKNSLILDLSDSYTEKLIATTNSFEPLTWSSSNQNIATVSGDGTVTGKSNGTATITVKTVDNVTASCDITVQTSPTGVSLNVTEQTLDLSGAKTFTIVPTIIPSTANVNTTIRMKSSNPNVASVSEQGVVTGISNGSSVITFQTLNDKTSSCNVLVRTSPTGVSLNKSSLSIDSSVSITERLTATITPSSSNIYTDLTWNSNNPNIATVSSDGLVTGRATGNTIITVNTQNGKSASCNVSVKIAQTEPDPPDTPTTISLNKSSLSLDLSDSYTEKLIATTDSSDSLIWSSSVSSVATVSNDGTVTGKSNGTTVITVRTTSGASATCDVTVQTSPTGVSLNVTEQTLDLSGTKTFTIQPTIIPSSANVNTTLFASSNDTDIATISEQGVVTGISNGNAVITVQTENGKSASCDVTVQTSPTGIYFEENKDSSINYLVVAKGSNKSVNAIIEPSTANVNTDIIYSISSGNSRVASINSSTGLVTGNQAGVVTIQAKTENGKSAKINLNVKIGNEAFDTYSTIKLRANTSEDLLYSKAVDLSTNSTIGETSHMQTSAIASNGDIYYCSYPGTSSNTSGKMHISIGVPNDTPYKCMTLNYFGHGSGFDLESGSGGGKVWIDSVTQGKSDTGSYGHGYAISRIQWANKSVYYFAAGTVNIKNTSGTVLKTYENTAGENFVFTTNGEVTPTIKVTIDERNRLIGIKKSTTYYVFDLDEALAITDRSYEVSTSYEDYSNCIVEFQAKDLNTITPLTSFKIPTATSEEDVTWYAWQGFDLDGDYIYIGEGHYTTKVTPTVYTGRAFVTVFDYMYSKNGNVPAKKKIEVAAVNEEWIASQKLLALMGDDGQGSYNLAQLEGLRVTTQGGKKELYLGFDSIFKSKGTRSANVLKYTY